MAKQPAAPAADGKPAKARTSSSAAERAPTAEDHAHPPPAQVTAEGVEPHPHRTGQVRVDRLIAAVAIFMSLLSLLIAFKHGMIMRDLVSANSWPLLQYSTSNTDEEQNLRIQLRVENAGVGPAIIKRFVVHHQGRAYTNPYRLLADCCGYTIPAAGQTKIVPGTPIVASVEGTVIRAGEGATYLFMDFVEGNAELWRRLDRARFDLRFDACYCSVLGECWRSDLRGVQQEKVDNCPAPSGAGPA